jgi:hypothetical protein
VCCTKFNVKLSAVEVVSLIVKISADVSGVSI